MKRKIKIWIYPLVVMGMVFMLTSSCKKDKDEINPPPPSDSIVKDIDGNVYHTVTIGKQVWMVENLKTTRYRNGDSIPKVTDNTQWQQLSTGAYCDYNNDSNNSLTYGRLYNGYAVADPFHLLCPEGWVVANWVSWGTLFEYLGGEEVAGAKLKEAGMIHWASPNLGADNSSGFTGLPGGSRIDGMFSELGYRGTWWTPDGFYGNSANLISYQLSYNNTILSWSNKYKGIGLSVRCVK